MSDRGRRGAPYARDTCVLDPLLKLAVIMTGRSPCAECSNDRAKCGGEPREGR